MRNTIKCMIDDIVEPLNNYIRDQRYQSVLAIAENFVIFMEIYIFF